MSEELPLEVLAEHVDNITSPDNSVQAKASEFITAWCQESPVQYIQALFQILQSCEDEGMIIKCLTLIVRPFQNAIASLAGDEVEKYVPPPELTIALLEGIIPLFSNENESIRNVSKSVFASGSILLVKMEVEYDPISILLSQLTEGADENICLSVFTCISDILSDVGFAAEQISAIYQTIFPLLSTENPAILSSIIGVLKALSPYLASVFSPDTQELNDFFSTMVTLTQEPTIVASCMSFWESIAENAYTFMKDLVPIMDIVLAVLGGEDEAAISATIQFVNCLARIEIDVPEEENIKMVTAKLGDLLSALINIAVQIESDETCYIDCVQNDALNCLTDILLIPGVLEEATEVLMEFISEGVQGSAGQIETAMTILETMVDSCRVDQSAIIPPSIQCSTSAFGADNGRIVLCGLKLMNSVITNCPTAEDFKALLNEDLFNLLDNPDKEIYENTAVLIQTIIKLEGFTEFESLFELFIEKSSVGSIIAARSIINVTQSPELIVPYVGKIIAVASLAVEMEDEVKASEAILLSKEAVLNAGEGGYPYCVSLFDTALAIYKRFLCPESIGAMALAARIERRYVPTIMTLIVNYTVEDCNYMMKVQSIESVADTMCYCNNISNYIDSLLGNLIRICYSTNEYLETKISAFHAIDALILFHFQEIEKYMERIAHLLITAIQQYENISADGSELVQFLSALAKLSTTIVNEVGPEENLIGAALQLIQYVADSENMSADLIVNTLNQLEQLMEVNLEQVKEMVESAPKLKELLLESLENLEREEEKEKLVKILGTLEIPIEEPAAEVEE